MGSEQRVPIDWIGKFFSQWTIVVTKSEYQVCVQSKVQGQNLCYVLLKGAALVPFLCFSLFACFLNGLQTSAVPVNPP